MNRFSLILLLGLICLNCGNSKADRLSSSGKRFARVYMELALLRDRIPMASPAYEDSSRALLKKLGYTPEDFRKSLVYFNEKPERWAAFYREVRKQLQVNKSSEAVRR